MESDFKSFKGSLLKAKLYTVYFIRRVQKYKIHLQEGYT